MAIHIYPPRGLSRKLKLLYWRLIPTLQKVQIARASLGNQQMPAKPSFPSTVHVVTSLLAMKRWNPWIATITEVCLTVAALDKWKVENCVESGIAQIFSVSTSSWRRTKSVIVHCMWCLYSVLCSMYMLNEQPDKVSSKARQAIQLRLDLLCYSNGR